MSATVTTDIFCDFCSNWEHGCTGPTENRKKARKIVKDKGWIRKRGSDGSMKDVCPACQSGEVPKSPCPQLSNREGHG